MSPAIHHAGGGMVERVARAIFCADCDFGYSIRLTSLVDGVAEYTLTYADGSEPLTFASNSEASEHTEGRRNEVRARAVIEAMREPTHEILRAMAESKARDDEGEFLPLTDLIDFSGENKTRTALRAAWSAAIDASLAPAAQHDGPGERG